MATTKITDLTAYTDPVNTDVLPIVDVTSDVTKKVSIANVMKNASLGTAALPGIAFDGDPNTGIYSPGADQVAISTNGTGRLFVASDGKVGVGTASPATAVHISGSGTQRLRITGTGTANAILTLDAPSTFANYIEYGASASTPLVFYDVAAAAERARFDTSGRLGLGTSTAGAVFHVKGGNNNVCNIDNDGSQYTNISLLNNGTEKGAIYWDNTNTLFTLGSNAASSQVVFRASNAERMRLTSTGLGIGTTPSTLLHLKTANTTGDEDLIQFSRGAYEAGKIQRSAGDLKISGQNNLYLQADYTNSLGPADSNIVFTIDGGEAARIDSNKRLLVGTSSARSNFDGNTATPLFQIEGVTAATASASVVRGANDTTGSTFNLGKTRAPAVGGNTVVSSGDQIGIVNFQAADGTNLIDAASIQAQVDGTPGANDMPGRLVFSTTADGASSPTERMRIRSDGQTYWVADSPTIGTYGTSIGRAGLPGLFETYRNAGSANSVINAGGNAGQVVVYGDGDLENTNNRYTGFSDIRLKQNIEDSGSQWDDIKNVRVRKYELISDPSRRQIGVIAQELELTSPGLVVERGDDTTGEKHKSVAYSVLYMKAVKALQEAMERIEALEAKVAALEA
jgi:hypothetical protein